MNGLVDQKIVSIINDLPNINITTVFGCAAYICANRSCPGIINHTYLGDLKGGVVTSKNNEDDENLLLSQFISTAVSYSPSPISHLRWRKSLWNVPFNGLCTTLNVTTDVIAKDDKLRYQATLIMNEVGEKLSRRSATMRERHFSIRNSAFASRCSLNIDAAFTPTQF